MYVTLFITKPTSVFCDKGLSSGSSRSQGSIDNSRRLTNKQWVSERWLRSNLQLENSSQVHSLDQGGLTIEALNLGDASYTSIRDYITKLEEYMMPLLESSLRTSYSLCGKIISGPGKPRSGANLAFSDQANSISGPDLEFFHMSPSFIHVSIQKVSAIMSSYPNTPPMKDYIPQRGLLHYEDNPQYILCKPKLMPLKSVTLEKLEKMQKEAEEKLKQQKEEENEKLPASSLS
uniref:Uncharacterized protein n=1 Tax=Timema monikensis TaxID=170555 RepID=A0A7R9E3I7_9NEOP|nr:unnamed protein product [Timema monikensis]